MPGARQDKPAYACLFPLCPVSFTILIPTGGQNPFRLFLAVTFLYALTAAEHLASVHHIPFVHQFAALVAQADAFKFMVTDDIVLDSVFPLQQLMAQPVQHFVNHALRCIGEVRLLVESPFKFPFYHRVHMPIDVFVMQLAIQL